MTDEEYVRKTLGDATDMPDEMTVRLKAMSEDGGTSNWVRLPPHVRRLVTVMASLTEVQANALTYALSCLVEDPAYFDSKRTNGALAEIYGLLHPDS